MGRLRLNRRKHTTSLQLYHRTSIRISISLSMCHRTCTYRRINTQWSSHTLRVGGVEISEVEEEEDLAEEEVKPYVITMDSQAIMPKIAKNLWRHVHIAKRRTIMWSNVPSWLQSGNIGTLQVLTPHRIPTQIQILTWIFKWLFLIQESQVLFL